ncbi:MAG: SUMF1/EgtB/PvdO family nonheme iron enzyme [Planctomycetota bacterium]|nr:SUMF1/EgtB/PvdO family nonheme iron enzyme [Planctomycetota bacterium]
MRMRVFIVALGAMLLAAGMAQAITISTIPVGDPGNAADTRYPDTRDGISGFGAVAYTYNIGAYEVTAGQYTAFLNFVATTDTYALYNPEMANTEYGSGITRSGASGSYTYTVNSHFANRPVNYVCWGDAARFANWLHNGQPTGAQNEATTEDGAYYLNGATSDAELLAVTRQASWKWAITSEDEWYKAAYYKGGGTNAEYCDYPTGSNTPPGNDMADPSGNNANYNPGTGPYPIDSGKYTTLVGEFQNSASPYGTFDQGGNVWEWNEALVYETYRGLRGGSFTSDANGGLLASNRHVGDTWGEDSTLGFRVSQVPEPASTALLALGGLAVIRKRRP